MATAIDTDIHRTPAFRFERFMEMMAKSDSIEGIRAYTSIFLEGGAVGCLC